MKTYTIEKNWLCDSETELHFSKSDKFAVVFAPKNTYFSCEIEYYADITSAKNAVSDADHPYCWIYAENGKCISDHFGYLLKSWKSLLDEYQCIAHYDKSKINVHLHFKKPFAFAVAFLSCSNSDANFLRESGVLFVEYFETISDCIKFVEEKNFPRCLIYDNNCEIIKDISASALVEWEVECSYLTKPALKSEFGNMYLAEDRNSLIFIDRWGAKIEKYNEVSRDNPNIAKIKL